VRYFLSIFHCVGVCVRAYVSHQWWCWK